MPGPGGGRTIGESDGGRREYDVDKYDGVMYDAPE
jgi:hypothetical protein